MATFLLHSSRVKVPKNSNKPHSFYQIHFIWQIDMKHGTDASELLPPPNFSLIPSKREKWQKAGL